MGTPERGRLRFQRNACHLWDHLNDKIRGMNTATGELKQGTVMEFREALTEILGKFVLPILEH
jgi:hypothetical protein